MATRPFRKKGGGGFPSRIRHRRKNCVEATSVRSDVCVRVEPVESSPSSQRESGQYASSRERHIRFVVLRALHTHT